jgi:hypothetical protein
LNSRASSRSLSFLRREERKGEGEEKREERK